MWARNSIPGKPIAERRRPGDKTCRWCGRSYRTEDICEDGSTKCPRCGRILRKKNSSKQKED